MSTSPTPSTSPTESTLGASLQCPVCYEMFGTRIFQCCQGHSVCDKCYGKISNQQCPQCRSNYMGTRNYILEEMIKTLKMLKSGSSSEIDAKKDKKMSQSGDEKLTNEIAKLVKLIPSVEEVAPEPAAPVAQGTNQLSAVDLLRMAAAASDSDDDDLAEFQAILNHAMGDTNAPARQNRANHVAQPGGLFHCRMLSCDERLPICRMWNHIRTFHAGHMVEQAADANEFVTHFSFPYASYRRALHIPRFGLFFIIVNVKRSNKLNVITAWVQLVGRREECRRFSYELNLRVGNRIATYKDVAYGDWSDVDYLQEHGECLLMKTNQTNTTRFRETEVTLSINKRTTATYEARSTETKIEEISSRSQARAAAF